MEKIIGLINAPFTPFYENGEVNYEPIEAYAKMLVKNGLQGVFINGSSGEGYMLTDEERMKLAERWVEVSPKGFKVIVHVGSCCVKSSVMRFLPGNAPFSAAPGAGSRCHPRRCPGHTAGHRNREWCCVCRPATPELRLPSVRCVPHSRSRFQRCAELGKWFRS